MTRDTASPLKIALWSRHDSYSNTFLTRGARTTRAQMLHWRPIESGASGPSARWAHSLTGCSGLGAALLFGGFAGAEYLDDAWILRASPRRALGLEWARPFPTHGSVPSARSNHAAICLSGSRFVICGGGGLRGTKHGDVYLLTLDMDYGLQSQPVPHAAASSGTGAALAHERSFHAGARLHDSAFCLFGGSSACHADTDDLRVCSLVLRPPPVAPAGSSAAAADTLRLVCQTEVIVPSRGRSWPAARRLHAMAQHARSGAVILHGGCAGAQFTPLGDTWALQPHRHTVTVDAACTNGLELDWEELQCVGRPPPPRCGHSLTAIPGSDALILFGGSVEGRPTDSVSFDASEGLEVRPVAGMDSADLYVLRLRVIDQGGVTSMVRVADAAWTIVVSAAAPRSLAPLGWPPPRRRHGAAVLDGAHFVVFGGFDGARYLNDAHVVLLSDLFAIVDASAELPTTTLPVGLGRRGISELLSDCGGDRSAQSRSVIRGDGDPWVSFGSTGSVPSNDRTKRPVLTDNAGGAGVAAIPDPFGGLSEFDVFGPPATAHPTSFTAMLPDDLFSSSEPRLTATTVGASSALSAVSQGRSDSRLHTVPQTWTEVCATAVQGLGFGAGVVRAAIAALEASPTGFAPYASPAALAEYVCEHAEELERSVAPSAEDAVRAVPPHGALAPDEEVR